MWDSLGGLLPKRLEQLRLKKGVDAERILLRWPDVAGRILGADQTEVRAVSIKEGILNLEVSSGIWSSEIRLKEPLLLKEINQPEPPQPIRGIKMRLAESKNPGSPEHRLPN